jgi:hypothetical protein
LQCSKYPFQEGKGKGKAIGIFILLYLIPSAKQVTYSDGYFPHIFKLLFPDKGRAVYKREKDNNISLSSFYFSVQEKKGLFTG